MYNKGFIIPGIILFLLLFSSPFWLNITAGEKSKTPELKYPEKPGKCIRSREYMRANHMDILNKWRDSVVRNNARFTASGNIRTEMSLTKTCLNCHDDKQAFCDRCHEYLEVTPYCWDCHTEPKGVKPPNE